MTRVCRFVVLFVSWFLLLSLISPKKNYKVDFYGMALGGAPSQRATIAKFLRVMVRVRDRLFFHGSFRVRHGVVGRLAFSS